MTVRELRQKYLAFFESKGHLPHPSGSLVPIDVTGRLDESLLFNGAGMVQFKPFFRGVAEPPSRRLATAQKCLRTGDIESVGDSSHLTFFEMLGNFSFGDYFKVETIDYSWEFLTSRQWLGLDPKRLAFTVFREDDEAFDRWSQHLASVGIDPACRVFRLGEETNYWPAGAFSNGPPGPCGPNSEMFYWVEDDRPPLSTSASYSVDDYLRDEAEGRWLEIWNDVFIQYEWKGEAKAEGGYTKTGMPELPFRSIDTGMGIERTCAVLGGYSSVYDTDAFQPVFRTIEAVGGHRFRYGEDEQTDRALRIVADHIRAACFCIGDGILPSNTGRGYVLRRLIRRAILKGQRVLGFNDLFAFRVLDGLAEALGDHYQELHFRRDVIVETLRNEEAQFRRTLEQGSQVLTREIVDLMASWAGGEASTPKVLPGTSAFMLYDTYGFPLEVTKEICEEEGLSVDEQGFRSALIEAQERSRGADQRESVYGGVVVGFVFDVAEDDGPTPTTFTGYGETKSRALIVGAVPRPGDDGLATREFALALDQTPFYAESGGQMSDTGMLSGPTFTLRVKDVVKQDGVFVHIVEPELIAIDFEGRSIEEAQKALTDGLFRQAVDAQVDERRRADIVRNHTATHLIHAALRKVLGKHVTQAGSLVAPGHLRFDFTHGKAMTPDEVRDVERIVNEHALGAEKVVVYTDVPIDDARAMGAMALFGEKYSDRVRVVQIGEMSPSEPSFSRELCGGVHVRNTGEIGLIKVVHEASAASGVRRIEAVTGLGAYQWVLDQQATLHEASVMLKSQPKEVIQGIERLIDQLKDERKKRERLAQQGGAAQAVVETIGAVEFAVENLNDADPKDAQLVADRLADNRPNRVSLVTNASEGKLFFVCKVGKDALAKGAHAGNIVKAAAAAAGGGGGGKAEFATAGGRDAAKLEDSLSAAREALAAVAPA